LRDCDYISGLYRIRLVFDGDFSFATADMEQVRVIVQLNPAGVVFYRMTNIAEVDELKFMFL
jgi:hypothetical protein